MSDDIYDLLLRRGLTRSQRHFSTYWAGCAPNYLALGGGISDTVPIAVFRRLVAERCWWTAFEVARLILKGAGWRVLSPSKGRSPMTERLEPSQYGTPRRWLTQGLRPAIQGHALRSIALPGRLHRGR